MKNFILILCFFLSLQVMAQNIEKVKNEKEIVWFGIDFSHVKFIGLPKHFNDLQKIRDLYFYSINYLIINESKKFDLKGAFKKSTIIYDIDSSTAKNERIDINDIVQIKPNSLSKEQLSNIVNGYANPTSNKIGLLFVIESLNKFDNTEAIWITFFDIASGNIIFNHKLIAKPSGVGFRNYWAGGIYYLIKQSKKDFNKWLSLKK
ncbi:MAG: hypothetical protein A2X02_02075 [Bacteroidetes bacterium GWF2_29_10]|nr:MAG: hypothetical protein A2X02_02075 [Bacteroidetes bacterium GWF2_29_10]